MTREELLKQALIEQAKAHQKTPHQTNLRKIPK